MANDTQITVVGNLTADPDLRFTNSGVAVASFTIASTPRTFDRATGEWKNGDSLFLRCSAWREMADNIAQSLTKGLSVIAQGRLVQRSYQAQDGTNRTSYELQVDEIGPNLRRATAQVTKNASSGSFNGENATGAVPNMAPAAAAPASNNPTTDDPWANDVSGVDVDPTDLAF